MDINNYFAKFPPFYIDIKFDVKQRKRPTARRVLCYYSFRRQEKREGKLMMNLMPLRKFNIFTLTTAQRSNVYPMYATHRLCRIIIHTFASYNSIKCLS